MESSTLMFKDPFCSLAHLHLISSSPLLFIPQSVYLHFPLSLLHSSLLPFHPSLPSLPPTSAQGCQSFRDPVSCEIVQIAVALRLARQQRGGGDREKEREILCFNTSEPESPTSPSPPSPYSLRHGQAHAQLQDCYPLQPKYLPPQHTYTHRQLLPSSPSSSPALSM